MSRPSNDAGREPGRVHLLARRLCDENTVFSVYFDHVEDEAGNAVPKYLSVVPKAAGDDAVTGVSVLPLVEGRFGLLRVFRHPLSKASWEAPKGMRESGEDLTAAALRELKEETGYGVAPDCLTDLGFAAPEPGLIQGRIRLYSARVRAGAISDLPEAELGHAAMALFTWREIVELVEAGGIDDACTLSILFKHQLSSGKSPPSA